MLAGLLADSREPSLQKMRLSEREQQLLIEPRNNHTEIGKIRVKVRGVAGQEDTFA